MKTLQFDPDLQTMLLLLLAPLLVALLVSGECPPHPTPANGHLVESVWVPGALTIRCCLVVSGSVR